VRRKILRVPDMILTEMRTILKVRRKILRVPDMILTEMRTILKVRIKMRGYKI